MIIQFHLNGAVSIVRSKNQKSLDEISASKELFLDSPNKFSRLFEA